MVLFFLCFFGFRRLQIPSGDPSAGQYVELHIFCIFFCHFCPNFGFKINFLVNPLGIKHFLAQKLIFFLQFFASFLAPILSFSWNLLPTFFCQFRHTKSNFSVIFFGIKLSLSQKLNLLFLFFIFLPIFLPFLPQFQLKKSNFPVQKLLLFAYF